MKLDVSSRKYDLDFTTGTLDEEIPQKMTTLLRYRKCPGGFDNNLKMHEGRKLISGKSKEK
jgi:hypothetical protein